MASKPATAKSAPAKQAGKAPTGKPAATKTAPAPVQVDQADEAGVAKLMAQMRVKDLIDRVIVTTDQNRKDVKIVVDAALAELAKALNAGEVLNLPPLGKIRIANQRSDEAGVAMTLKLRRNTDSGKDRKGEKQALAEVGEAG